MDEDEKTIIIDVQIRDEDEEEDVTPILFVTTRDRATAAMNLRRLADMLDPNSAR